VAKQKPKTNPNEFVARVDPNAKHGDWQGKFVNAPSDSKSRAKAIDTARKGLAKNAARQAAKAESKLHNADPTRY